MAWEGKSRGNKLGYRIFVFILKYVGLRPAYLVLRLVALYFFLFLFKASKPIFRYFHLRLGYGRLKSLRKTYSNFYLLGQTILDKLVLLSDIPNKFSFEFDGEENLLDISQQKRGGLLLSAHLGNWDIAGHLLKRLNTRINIVIFDGEHEQIKSYIAQIIKKQQVKFIVIKNDLSHIYEISEAFANNELVCMHADRFLEGNKTIAAHFLGKTARFPMGPFVLAAQFKVPVSYVFAFKETDLHYHLFASQPREYGHLKKNEAIEAIANDFVAEIENKIGQYPEQWFNYYDFWK